jgi:hypothetical protein
MVVVVDVEEEKKVSKFEEHKVVEGVIVKPSQVLVKAIWLQRSRGEALRSQCVGKSRSGYCFIHLPW